MGPGKLSTGGSGDSGEGVVPGELRDTACVTFSRVEVAVVVSAVFILTFLSLFVVCFSERSP